MSEMSLLYRARVRNRHRRPRHRQNAEKADALPRPREREIQGGGVLKIRGNGIYLQYRRKEVFITHQPPRSAAWHIPLDLGGFPMKIGYHAIITPILENEKRQPLEIQVIGALM